MVKATNVSRIDLSFPRERESHWFTLPHQDFRWPKLFACLLLCFLSACATPPETPTKLDLKPIRFTDLPGWQRDQVSEALPALQSSCNVLLKRAPNSKIGSYGTVADWFPACNAIKAVTPQDDAALRHTLTQFFRAYAVTNVSPERGLFTGYYEPELQGSLTPSADYATPLWPLPEDLITVNLGDFKPELAGQKITGKVSKRKLVPYDDRAAIAAGSLQNRAEPLVWVRDPIDAFFLEIQGSGRVTLPNGDVLQIGYAGQNGHGYVPVGRVLADEGKVARPVSMQKIRAYMAAHPDDAQRVMNRNPSAVFFRKLDKAGAVGAQGVVLTPRRSLAVDPAFVPLGTPMWLSTNNGLQRLVVAQDTGGAIKGAVRGDYFWGHGEEAAHEAGIMQAAGTYYLLLPQALDPIIDP